eukprot:INCI4633.2.p2 GENE.INCI4633.2~~INCI4633.2.p2  ORF type:complete len:392 (+),score=92.66 INCI4633.2:311-1486(+)
MASQVNGSSPSLSSSSSSSSSAAASAAAALRAQAQAPAGEGDAQAQEQAPRPLFGSLQLGFQDDWLVTLEQLRDRTPSRFDDISFEEEIELRTVACFHIDTIRNTHSSGDFIRQQVVSTAKLLLQRFYTQHSFNKHPWKDVALAALFLAAKVEDRPVKVVEVLNRHFRWADPSHQDFVERSRDEEYLEMKSRVLKFERIILHTLSFNVTYSMGQQDQTIRSLATTLAATKPRIKALQKAAKSFLNDSFNTVAALLFAAEKVAAATVYLGLRMLGPAPDSGSNPTSASGQPSAAGAGAAAGSSDSGDSEFQVFGASRDEITTICNLMFSVYQSKSRLSGKVFPKIVALQQLVEAELQDNAGGVGGASVGVGMGTDASDSPSAAKRTRRSDVT